MFLHVRIQQAQAANTGSAILALAYCSIALLTSALATPPTLGRGQLVLAAWLVDRDGAIYSMGGAPDYGSASNQWASPIVGMATTPDDGGYWEVARDGRIYPFGNAGNYGWRAEWYSPMVGMAATPDGQGYWEVAADGRIYAFGDASNYGLAGSQHLNAPIVGMAVTPDGKGYWEVASDGGIFNYGNAGYYGSTAASVSTGPWSALRPPPTAAATGWRLATGASSPSATLRFTERPQRGTSPRFRPSPPPPTGRYLEAATDGALFPWRRRVDRIDLRHITRPARRRCRAVGRELHRLVDHAHDAAAHHDHDGPADHDDDGPASRSQPHAGHDQPHDGPAGPHHDHDGPAGGTQLVR